MTNVIKQSSLCKIIIFHLIFVIFVENKYVFYFAIHYVADVKVKVSYRDKFQIAKV